MGARRTPGKVQTGGSRSPVPDWVPDDLPAAPGVYRFAAGCGTTLYVGKSVNLKRRVRGWFYGGGPAEPRLAEMLALARAVRIEPAGSDLEARLVEAERIVAERPPYNRALKNRARGWYLEIDRGDPFPRVRVVRRARQPKARVFGPYRGRALPETMARLVERAFLLRSCSGRIVPDAHGSPCLAFGLDLCTGPCVKAVGLDDYRRQVERAIDALASPGSAAREAKTLRKARDRAAARLAFERAARIQRRLDWLEELEEARSAAVTPWMFGTWLVALPAAAPGRSVLLPFVRGRTLPRTTIRWSDSRWEAHVADVRYAVGVAELAADPVIDPAAAATGSIVSEWLLNGAPGGLPLDLERLDDAEIVDLLVVWSRISRESAAGSGAARGRPTSRPADSEDAGGRPDAPGNPEPGTRTRS